MHAARWILAALAVAALGATGATARADLPEACYTLYSTVLTGPEGADLTVRVATAEGCTTPTELKKLQIKTFTGDKLDGVSNLNDVALDSGAATIELGQLARGSRIESDALIQGESPDRTWQTRSETNALLRPDLTVAAVQAPAQTLTVRPIDVLADITELNGDVGATATVTLSWARRCWERGVWTSPRAAESRRVQRGGADDAHGSRAHRTGDRGDADRDRCDEQRSQQDRRRHRVRARAIEADR